MLMLYCRNNTLVIHDTISNIDTKIDQINDVNTKVDGISADILVLKSDLGVVGTQVNSTIAAVHSRIDAAIPETTSRLNSIEHGVTTLIAQSPEIITENARGMQELSIEFHQLATKTDQNSASIQSSITSIQGDTTGMLTRLLKIEEALGIGNNIEEVDYRTALQRFVAKPSYTKQICDDISDVQGMYATHQSGWDSRNNLMRGCRCQQGQYWQSNKTTLWPFWFRQHSVIRGHRSDCKYAIPGMTKKTRSLDIVTQLQSFSVWLAISITTGGRGRSISPKITFRPVVQENQSPVFEVLRLLGFFLSRQIWPDDEVHQITSLSQKIIFRLYQEKKCSPYEVNEVGWSFLHFWATFVAHTARQSQSLIQHEIFHAYTKRFLQAGLPADICDNSGQ